MTFYANLRQNFVLPCSRMFECKVDRNFNLFLPFKNPLKVSFETTRRHCASRLPDVLILDFSICMKYQLVVLSALHE